MGSRTTLFQRQVSINHAFTPLRALRAALAYPRTHRSGTMAAHRMRPTLAAAPLALALAFALGTALQAPSLQAQERRQLPDIGSSAGDRKSTRLNSSHVKIPYAVFCLKKKKWPS